MDHANGPYFSHLPPGPLNSRGHLQVSIPSIRVSSRVGKPVLGPRMLASSRFPVPAGHSSFVLRKLSAGVHLQWELVSTHPFVALGVLVPGPDKITFLVR